MSKEKLFLFGVSIYSLVNWFLSYFFYLFSLKKVADYNKLRRWKQLISKILVFALTLIATWSKCLNQLNTWEDVFFLGSITIAINCCFIDLLIQFMNRYGICNAFSLIFFTDYLRAGWIKKSIVESSFQFLACFLLTIFFIWITNIKWEVPIETNVLLHSDNSLLQKGSTKFGFKLNLSFMNFYQLSWFISLLHGLMIISENAGRNLNWKARITELVIRGELLKKNLKQKISQVKDNVSIVELFFILNEEKKPFSYRNWLNFRIQKSEYCFALCSLIFLQGVNNWLQIVLIQWNSQEIAQDLRKKGIYFDAIGYGKPTEVFLKKKINNLIFFWYLVILAFQIVFDNTTGNISNLSFIDWFSSINLGANIIQQIRTKYKYLEIK